MCVLFGMSDCVMTVDCGTAGNTTGGVGIGVGVRFQIPVPVHHLGPSQSSRSTQLQDDHPGHQSQITSISFCLVYYILLSICQTICKIPDTDCVHVFVWFVAQSTVIYEYNTCTQSGVTTLTPSSVDRGDIKVVPRPHHFATFDLKHVLVVPLKNTLLCQQRRAPCAEQQVSSSAQKYTNRPIPSHNQLTSSFLCSPQLGIHLTEIKGPSDCLLSNHNH
jgi:hypothetical protein